MTQTHVSEGWERQEADLFLTFSCALLEWDTLCLKEKYSQEDKTESEVKETQTESGLTYL